MLILQLITENACGEVLHQIIKNEFKISGLLSFHFNLDIAHELMDVYSSVYPSYSLMIDQLCTAPLMAVMITGSTGKIWYIQYFYNEADDTVWK